MKAIFERKPNQMFIERSANVYVNNFTGETNIAVSVTASEGITSGKNFSSVLASINVRLASALVTEGDFPRKMLNGIASHHGGTCAPSPDLRSTRFLVRACLAAIRWLSSSFPSLAKAMPCRPGTLMMMERRT
ncbi:hypothetical protein BIW11_09748 [Tropilaelaps mercedesae]|uniref:Uncharacterized protein n=1 Tax=Tropilaelaps mercedesae TaxID=418985 RepID=A0A1V9XIY7_9ACAR|nr:hypothetical protein BIW11_09748 [Tropilaelaps mercedesae]